MDEMDAHQRMAAQSPQAEKIANADRVVENDGTVEEVEAVIQENKGKWDIKLIHQIPRDHINSDEKQSGKM